MTASLIRNRLVVASCLTLSVAISACKATSEDVAVISGALNSGGHTNAVTVDGVLSPGEWSDATSMSFSFCAGDNPATLYVKNDATTLYAAFVVDNARWRLGPPPPGGQNGNDFLNLDFDNDGDGTIEIGDDYWAVRGGDGLTDDAYNQDGSPQHAFSDDFSGGTKDIVAAVTHTNPVWDGVGTYVAEYRGPLDSADDLHDLSAHPGQTIGIIAVFATAAPCANGDRYWPSVSTFEPLTLSGGAPPVLLPDGSSCTTDGACASNHCVGGLCCNSPCDGGVCQTCAAAAGATADGVCTTLGSSHTCRAAAGACDVAEACDGTNPTCPADVLVSAGQICRPLAGACDVAETCNGTAACPTDGFAPVGTVCHTPAGPCEATAVCPGDGAACPASTPAPSPTCTFMLRSTGTRQLKANLTGSSANNHQDDMFSVTATGDPTTLQTESTGPFGNSYAFDDWTVVDGGVTMTVGSRISGTAALGHLTGRVQCDASTNMLGSVDPNNSFGRGVEQQQWSDQLTVTSSTLAPGTAVQFLLQLQLDSHLTNLGEETSTSVPASFQTYVYSTAAAGSTTLSLMESLAMPLVNRSTTAIVSTTVGATLNISGTLQVQGAARLKLQTPVSVTADASNTAIVRLTPITAGASYAAASGRGLYAPDAVAPTVHIAEPDPGEIVRGIEPVIVRARDDLSGVALVQVWAGATLIGECHQAPCRVLLDTRRFPEGPLVLRASARDFEGNVSRDDHQYVVVDNKRRRAQHCDERYGGHW